MKQVKHHMRYKEIDGEDYVIPITFEAHISFHKLNPDSCKHINASYRTYNKTNKRKENDKKIRKTLKYKKYHSEYMRKRRKNKKDMKL